MFAAIENGAVRIINHLLLSPDTDFDVESSKLIFRNYYYDASETPLMCMITLYSHSFCNSDSCKQSNKKCQSLCIEQIEKLLSHPKMTRQIVNHRCDSGWTALGYVLTLSQKSSPVGEKVLALLLEHGADINIPTFMSKSYDFDRKTAKLSHYTAALGIVSRTNEHLNMFKMVFNMNNEILFDKDEINGMTTLMCAVEHKHYNIVNFIINQLNSLKQIGKRNITEKIENFIHARRTENGDTAYLIACKNGDSKMVEYLVKALNINVQKCCAKELHESDVAKANGHD